VSLCLSAIALATADALCLPVRSFSEDGPRLKFQISNLKSSINKSLSYYTRMQYTVMQHSEKLVPLWLLKKHFD